MNSDEFMKSVLGDITNDMQKMFDSYILDLVFAGKDLESTKLFMRCLLDQGVTMEQILKAARAYMEAQNN